MRRVKREEDSERVEEVEGKGKGTELVPVGKV